MQLAGDTALCFTILLALQANAGGFVALVEHAMSTSADPLFWIIGFCCVLPFVYVGQQYTVCDGS